ncbi:hypothetical protein PS898_05346 [Pseudomonas fluorescens]|nr:hypothetical protein PS898_05346 [Pseudomonas fluorescens]
MKLPKKTSASTTPPSSSASRPVAGAELPTDPITATHVGRATPGHSSTSVVQPTSSSSSGTGSQSAMVVTPMLYSPQDRILAAIKASNWPKDKIHELRPVSGNSGLFEAFDGMIYAFVGGEDYMCVVRRADGEYQSPMVTSPGVAYTFRKIDGEARWDANWLPLQGLLDADVPRTVAMPGAGVTRTVTMPEALEFLPTFLADTLTPSEKSAQGVRYDRASRPYVDTIEGTIMVHRHPDGSYQHRSPQSLIPTGRMVEQIPGQKMWRFIEEWIAWGKKAKPETGESLALNGHHYPIVPVGTQANDATRVYFLQHPDFSPTHFDSFERMLHEAPDLQPVPVWRSSESPLKVHVGEKSFTQPLTESVREMFSEFSDSTARSVARMLFERADYSRTITSAGLLKLQRMTDQWRLKPQEAASWFAEPMDMLPVLPRVESGGKATILLPPEVNGPLQRLTFDPQRFRDDWTIYLQDPTLANLRLLVRGVLGRAGYKVATFTTLDSSTLVFLGKTRNTVYYLTLAQVNGNAVEVGGSPAPGAAVLADPDLRARVGGTAYKALMDASTSNKIVWLQGGAHRDVFGRQSVFIIREL